MKRSQIALNTISLRGEFKDIVAAVAEAGFSHIEFPLWGVEDTPETVKQMLNDYNLNCIGGFQTCITAAPDAEANAPILKNAQWLSTVGNGRTTLVAGTDTPLTDLADPIASYAQTVGELAQKIAPFDVNLAIEFNWGAVKTLAMAAEIARQSGAPNAGVLFDPAHFYCTPTKFVDLTPENVALIKHVHVDNMRRKPAEISDCNSDRTLPDDPSGILDLKELFGQIESHGYTSLFSIEMFSDELWAMSPREAAKRMFDSLMPLCE